MVGQSIPNPTDGTVVIPYFVPAAALAAELVVWNSAGAEVCGSRYRCEGSRVR